MTTGAVPVTPTLVPSRLTAAPAKLARTEMVPLPLPESLASQMGASCRRAVALALPPLTVSVVKLSTTARFTSRSLTVT